MLTVLLALLIAGADQIGKALIVRALPVGGSVTVIPGVLSLTHVQNTGIAFGLLRGLPLPVLLLAALTVVFLLIYNWTRPGGGGPRDLAGRAALGCLLGGAAGNLVDRVRLGYVIDYLDLHVWPVFNLADAAVVFGGVLLLVAAVRQRPSRGDPRRAARR
ncbi:MAG: signal peptidase II [Armatimonadetes bacterium]|nr:signal peptidase II [Armatimonadota bacterium]